MMIDFWRPLGNQQHASLKNARSAYCYKMPVHDPWKTLQNDHQKPFFKKHKSPHSVEEMCRGIKFQDISIMFGEHVSMLKNKASFCRHIRHGPGPHRSASLFWVARFSVIKKISGKGLYKMTLAFLTCPGIPEQVRTRISTKWVHGKISVQSAAPL